MTNEENNEEFDLIREKSKKSNLGKFKQTSVSYRSLVLKMSLTVGIVLTIGIGAIGTGIYNAVGAFLGN